MKSLNELIEQIAGRGEGEAMANTYYREHDDRSSQHYFRAGYRACFDLLAPALKILQSEIQNFITREAQDGSNQACTYCDMGGSGRSSKGDGHHDDVRDSCPVVLLSKAMSNARAILEGRGE